MIIKSTQDFLVEYDIFSNKDIVVIGRGKDANKFKYRSQVPVFCINTAVEFYPNPWYVVMVEPHFKELKDIPLFLEYTTLLIKKRDYTESKVVTGCTPTIFISFMLNRIMKPNTKIYLQGFSMDEESNKSYPSKLRHCLKYNWERQIEAFKKCQLLAEKKQIELILIDKNKKLSFIKQGIPPEEMLHG